MIFKTVGRTGIRVSALSLGTMSFGSSADKRAAKNVFESSREAGINLIDCANSYSGSQAESILGELISEANCRDEIVLTTKVCRPTGHHVNGQGLSRHHIMREVENSLRRLRTDRIDFYFMHHYDPLTPVEESLRAFDDLQREGKILYPAVSNWSAWRTARALGTAQSHGWTPFALVQPMYNLLKREAEVELLPMAEAEGLGVMVYSPLASGLLTGLFGDGGPPSAGRLSQPRYRQRYGEPANYSIAGAFTRFAADNGLDPIALAVSWAMSHPAVTSATVGPESSEQLYGYLGALDIPMTSDLRHQLGQLSDVPDASVERTVD